MTYIKFLLVLIPVLINEYCCLNEMEFSEPCRRKFIIVVDGGSSGTRLHFFEFLKNDNNMKLHLTDKISSKVALSKFSNARTDWSLMRIMFNNLTSFAMSNIPEQCIEDTPIYVQVTAGVRQIDQTMSKKILNHIRSILLKSKLNFKPEFVDILSTEKEGRLAWVSLNYLLGKFQSNKISETVGMLDLGGGSTQISFATNNVTLIPHSVKMVLFGQQYNVYTAGYDYMGINEIRIRYLNASNCFGLKCQNQTVRSECLHPKVKAHFHFGNRTLVIGGKPIKSCRRFCNCFLKGLKMVQPVIPIRGTFDEMEFVAISAYYYIIKSAFNITKQNEKDLMEFSVKDIIFRAMDLCKNPKKEVRLDSYEHFLCLDMSYIVALLHNGYGYEWFDKINISIRINKISLSWALGYAISML